MELTLAPVLFDAQARRDKVQGGEFFHVAADCAAINTDRAGYRGIGRGAPAGFLGQSFNNRIDRKAIGADLLSVLVNTAVVNISVVVGCRVARSHTAHTKPFQ